MCYQTIKPDHKRIEILEQAFRDFRLYFEGNMKAKLLFQHQFRKYYFMLPPVWRIALRLPSWKKRVKPDFISTGAVRSGTSTLSSYIFQHPCVVLPLAKEIMTWHKTSILMAQFPHKKEKQKIEDKFGVSRIGTGTPVIPSLTWPYVGKALNPDLKIVIILRNPVDRVISQWRWDRMLGKSVLKDSLAELYPDFDEHIDNELENFKYGGGFNILSGPVQHSYLANSMYLPFIRKVKELFGDENVKIIHAENFFKNPIPIVKETYQFLDLPEYEPIEIKETNPSFPLDLKDETREKLVEFFAPYNEELYKYLNIDFKWN